MNQSTANHSVYSLNQSAVTIEFSMCKWCISTSFNAFRICYMVVYADAKPIYIQEIQDIASTMVKYAAYNLSTTNIGSRSQMAYFKTINWTYDYTHEHAVLPYVRSLVFANQRIPALGLFVATTFLNSSAWKVNFTAIDQFTVYSASANLVVVDLSLVTMHGNATYLYAYQIGGAIYSKVNFNTNRLLGS